MYLYTAENSASITGSATRPRDMWRLAPMRGLGRGDTIWSVPHREATGWRQVQRALVRLLPFLLARVYLEKESEPNTTQELRMKPLSLILVTLLFFPLPAWSTDLLLFVIQRSKNANEVHYSLRVDDHCTLASDTPVHARWQLREESPEKTKPLSVFDQLAYGIAQQTVTENGVSFSLKALATKRMKASATPTAPPGTCAPRVSPTFKGRRPS